MLLLVMVSIAVFVLVILFLSAFRALNSRRENVEPQEVDSSPLSETAARMANILIAVLVALIVSVLLVFSSAQ